MAKVVVHAFMTRYMEAGINTQIAGGVLIAVSTPWTRIKLDGGGVSELLVSSRQMFCCVFYVLAVMRYISE